MSKKNVFELSNRKSNPRDIKQNPPRVWSQEEQAAKLNGYLEVPHEFWDQIKYGTHIRYYSKTEGFRPGGFVVRNPVEVKKDDGSIVSSLKLQNGFNAKDKGYLSWFVVYDSVSKIFIKPDAAVSVALHSLQEVVKGLNENMRKMADEIMYLKSKLSK